jgi:G:T/U-mismatch repair DNA glycosylase
MEIETHPFEPFMPSNARLLMLGTFPPAEKRWCMKFYYPNFQNDMWRIIGLDFFSNKNYFVIPEKKTFDLLKLKAFLRNKGIAIYDTAYRIRRTKNTASDKDLDIVEQVNIDTLLNSLPECKAVLTAGQLATDVFTSHFDIKPPKMGTYTNFDFSGHTLRLYRMPSSSRAYPMRLELKAEKYEKMFSEIF